MPIIDVMALLANESRQALHPGTGIVDVNGPLLNMNRHLFADERGGDRIGAAQDADEATPTDPYLLLDARRQRRRRHWLHHRHLFRHAHLPSAVALGHHIKEKGFVAINVGKLSTATQQQLLLERPFQGPI